MATRDEAAARVREGDAPRARVGFVGLGVMGAPMAANLAQAGFMVTVHDRDPGRMAAAREAAPMLQAAATLAEVAAAADVVVTMLPDGRVVRSVVADGGLADALRPGTLLIDTSSSEPWLTRGTADLLAARGVAMLDAPVSGAQWGAQAAELVFMVGGEPADLERARPLFDAMGRLVRRVGGLGAGHTMKCINNLITAMNFVATAEGLVIGKACGLDPEAMTEILDESTGGSWLTRNHVRQRVTSRSFDDPFRLALMEKDVGIALALAADAKLPLPQSALASQLYRAALLAAGEDASVSELVRWIERQTGVELTPGAG